ncbi:MAG: hypothetical protein PHV37_05570 [Candidatus Gastranaerophilales bacterium]|nr:hypothetical protein [Candidatus Gastranaerophilales bacterium]
MKNFKYFLALIIVTIAFSGYSTAAEAPNYDELYYNAQLFDTEFMHDVDPYQDQEYMKYTWSPYPLFRTSSTLYFKSLTIEPGYYLLTPRNLKDKDYVLFKDNGKVKFIVPVVKKTITDVGFYQYQVPKPKLTKSKTIAQNLQKCFFKNKRDSGRMPPPDSYIDVLEEGNYVIIKFYYSNSCYWLLFRKNKF